MKKKTKQNFENNFEARKDTQKSHSRISKKKNWFFIWFVVLTMCPWQLSSMQSGAWSSFDHFLHHKILKIMKIRKMTKLEKLKNEIFGKPKNWKCVRKMFLTKFLAKINFWRRNLSFQSHSSPQNIKNFAVNNMATSRWSKIEKHTDHFYIFSVPRRTIRGHQWIDLDLSCSELFFWVPCDSYSVLNDLICFCHFSRF